MFNLSEYEVSVNAQRQDIHRKAWKALMDGSSVETGFGISSEIYDGWMRSKSLGVDPNKKSVSRVLSAKELEKLKAANSFFLEVSRPALENLISIVYDSGFIATISDKDGILMEVFGDNAIVESTKEGNWVPGADWSEASIGNNSIGTSLVLQKPINIMGYEHFCRCCHHWSSASALIFDSDRQIIGTIALCGHFEKIHPHTLGMIVAAAHDIEMQLSIRNVMKEREIAYENQRVLIHAISDGVLGIDSTGVITFSNNKTYEILNAAPDSLIGLNFSSLVEPRNAKILLTAAKPLTGESIFNVGGIFTKCIWSSQPLISNGNFNGTVILLKNYDAAVMMANKLIGSTPKWTFDSMIGKNRHYLEMVHVAKVASKSDKSILILGESGTGKDVFAQSIHNESNRKDAPYVAINCGAIPKDLIASELFGYSDGAFTGAKKGGNKGKFETAQGGTIFLDEIGEMPLDQQVVLLRVLEESSLTRIGSSKKIASDVRVIAATSKNIIEEIKNQRFRQDLFYRLNVFTIKTLPLRERKDDIEELSYSFLQRSALELGRPFNKLSGEVLALFMEYDWPGNIRELQNVLERATVLSADGIILPEMIQLVDLNTKSVFLDTLSPQSNTKDVVLEYEANMLKQELEKCDWNITKVCSNLQISRPTLYRWLRKYNIEINRTLRE